MIRRPSTARALAATLCVGLGGLAAPVAAPVAALAQNQSAGPLTPSPEGSGMLFGAADNGVEVAETTKFNAEVLTVDEQTRQVLLRNLDTGKVSVHVPDLVQQGAIGVKSGDRIQGVITRGISARPAERDDEVATKVETISVPASTGGQAALVSGRLTRSVVELEAWNPITFVMVAKTPEGRTLRSFVPSPEAQAFLATQKPGSKIHLEVSEIAMLSKVE